MIRIKLREPAKENLPYYRKLGIIETLSLTRNNEKNSSSLFTQRAAHRFGVNRRDNSVTVQRLVPGQHLDGQPVWPLVLNISASHPGKPGR
jgi:hypothetical protein